MHCGPALEGVRVPRRFVYGLALTWGTLLANLLLVLFWSFSTLTMLNKLHHNGEELGRKI